MAHASSKRRDRERPCTVDGCDRPNFIDGRCVVHDELFRQKQRGICSAPGCTRAVWSGGLCSTHYQKRYQARRGIRQSFRGNDASRDDFVRLIERIIEELRARREKYIAYVLYAESGLFNDLDVRYCEQQLGMLRAILSVEQYNYVLRRVNDGLREGQRIPMYYEDSNEQNEQTAGQGTDAEGTADREAA